MKKSIYKLKNKWSMHTSTGVISKGVYIDQYDTEYFVKGNSEKGYLEPQSEVLAYRIA